MKQTPSTTRRNFLMATAGASLWAQTALARVEIPKTTYVVKPDERSFLEDYAKRCFRFFWEQTNSATGMTLDRAKVDGSPSKDKAASVSATGFGLTALCIGAEHKWITRAQARERVARTLNFFWAKAFHDHGFYFHFMDAATGKRALNSEISSIDTALLLAGVLTAAEYFRKDEEITTLARQIFERVDFAWMLNGDKFLLSHGTYPETGFIKFRWDSYSEASILYLLGIGSGKHPIPAESWYAWQRPVVHYEQWQFYSGGPLFTHQFSHAWVDFRHQQDGDPYWTNWFENSIFATYAHREFIVSLQSKYPDYGPDMWGVTASDSPRGYVAWGGPPVAGPINGTLVPCAAAGSLMLAPEICLPVLREMVKVYGDKIYQRYGFTDAFNPDWDNKKGWVSPDVVGIDVGISLLSAENLLTGNVWRWFMRNQHIQTGMERAGFRIASISEVAPRATRKS